MRRRIVFALLLLAAVASVAYVSLRRPSSLVLTGIITTNDVIISPQIDGRLAQLIVVEGDRVARDQVIALIDPRELAADSAYYTSSEAGAGAQVREAQAALHYQEHQTTDAIAQAASMLASAKSQQAEAAATLENARVELDRTKQLIAQGIASTQQMDQARMAYDVAHAHVDALARQFEAQQAALSLAQANAQQVAVRASQLQSSEHMRQAAAAQRSKADVRLAYTEVRSPIDGIVDVRAARPGEVVNRGQPIVTVINPDDLWVRVDVEETYIDRVRIGDRLQVRLPSGDMREGTVFYRGADAAFATERDVSRTKRDIKTFEIRLRVNNADRRLAVGMTTYVLLPVAS
jgi:HlyD family secretion protein